jgi:hypothetical protein
MADSDDVMRGLVALDKVIRDAASVKDGAPGSGLYGLLDHLAVTQLGTPRSTFPPAEPVEPPPELVKETDATRLGREADMASARYAAARPAPSSSSEPAGGPVPATVDPPGSSV